MLTSTGVTLVPFSRTHLECTRAWANDAEVMRLMDRAVSVSAEEHESWFSSLQRRPDCVYFAIEADAEHVGNVWLADIDTRHRKAELRIVVGAPHARERGVGARAIDLMCRHAFEHLGLHRIYAYVLAINPRARRAFEKAGFVVEGTLKDDRWSEGQFVDVSLLARVADV
jgi:UDP-4-amino-4,6-dideoxy-N-acetyl-beta-L-altrosamine N-acetyltransferase